MPWNALIFPLLGGFICLDWCFLTRLRNQRIDGNRLLLEGAFLGAILVSFTYVLVWYFESRRLAQGLSGWWMDVAPTDAPYLGTAILALCLGIVSPFMINRLIPKRAAKRYAITQAGDTLLGIFFDSATQLELVQIVLKNGKVYVGIVSVAPDLRPQSHVVLLPVVEGCRDKDTLEISYREKRSDWIYVWPAAEQKWAEVIVPLANIDSAKRVRSLQEL